MNTPRPRTVPLPPASEPASTAAAALAPQRLLAARERAIQLLSERYAGNAISEAEYTARLARLHSAADPAGVDAVVLDLLDRAPLGDRTQGAPPPPAPDERRILAVMGEIRRRGRWTVPRLLRVRALMGEVKLDVRDTPIVDGFTLDVRALGARVTLIVPPGVPVAFDVFAVMGNAISQADEPGPDTSSAPHVRVIGSAFMGEVRVLVRERAIEM